MAVSFKTNPVHVVCACTRMQEVHTNSINLKRREGLYLFGYAKIDPLRLHNKHAIVAADVLQCGEIRIAGQMIKLIF